MPALNSSQSLWDFALAFYAQPQVAETCLQLQDHHHANVCLVIGLHWLDERKQFLTDKEAAHLSLHIGCWTQQVITPLREMRRLLKQPVGNYVQDDTQQQLRTLIKNAELLAEKKLLNEIELWSANVSVAKAIAQPTNLAQYLATLNIEPLLIESILQTFNAL